MCLQIPDLGRVWSFGGNEEGHGSWVKLGHLSSSPGDQDPWSELEYLTPTQAPEVLTFCLPGAPAFFVLAHDAACGQRGLQMTTYHVVPMT